MLPRLRGYHLQSQNLLIFQELMCVREFRHGIEQIVQSFVTPI